MAKKNLFYNNVNNSTNVEKVVDIDDIKFGHKNYKGCIDYGFITITNEVFDKIKNNIIWPTEKPCIYGDYTEYLCSVIFRTQSNKYVLAFLIDTIYDDCICVDPVDTLIKGKKYSTCRIFPNRNVKCFETKAEYEADIIKKEKKNEHISSNFVPTFNLTTPKFKILEIHSKTACVPNIKVGDVLHDEIPVLKKDKGDKYPSRMLDGSSGTDYVDIYVNDKFIKTISPINFQNIFYYNFKVEIIK